jgi:CRP-like cAMP-binding protein
MMYQEPHWAQGKDHLALEHHRHVIVQCVKRLTEVETHLESTRATLAELVQGGSKQDGTNYPSWFVKDVSVDSHLYDTFAPADVSPPFLRQSSPLSCQTSPSTHVKLVVNCEPQAPALPIEGTGADAEHEGKTETEGVHIAINAEKATPKRVQIFDQILLDVPPLGPEASLGVDSQPVSIRVSTPTKKKAEPKKSKSKADDPRRELVLAQIGKDPSGKPNSVWIDRNKIIWISAFCCIRMPIFHPEADIRLIWNLMGFLFIVFEAFLIPLYIAFDYEASGIMMLVVSIVDTYFLIDLFFNFLTGLSVDGVTELSPKIIAKQYLTTWCVPDFLAGIPWEWLPLKSHGPFASATKCVRFVRAGRVLRVTRLLRLMRLGILTDTIEVIIESNRLFVFIAGLLRVLFLMFAITHWSACAWYMVGVASLQDTDGNGTNWINKFMHDATDIGTKYVYSVYFALTTMTTVGYGDISATNFSEVQFVLVLLFIASIVFAGLMGALTDLIGNLNNEGNVRAERKVMLSRYMRWRAVPKDLFVSVREYMLFIWDTNEGFGEYEMFVKEQLPPTLRKELSYHIYGRILRSAPFLAWMRGCEACLKELALTVESIFLSRGDYLFHVGQVNEHMYVLVKGTLYISQNEKVNLAPCQPDEYVETATQGSSGFSIPREQEASAFEIIRMMLGKGKEKVQKLQDGEENDAQTLLDMMKGPGDNSEEDEKHPVVEQGKKDVSLESHVDSHILHQAWDVLNKQDQRQQRSARYIQRRWKRKKGTLLGNKVRKHISVKSKFVHAPAYLGESCLWQPLYEWEEGQRIRHPYSACCETRSELVFIQRSAVKTIIEQFAPWLGWRFDFFRACVVDFVEQDREGTKKSTVNSADTTSDLAPAERSNLTTTKDVGTTPRCSYDMVAADLYAPHDAVPLYGPSGQDQNFPPGRLNYDAFSAMNHGLYSPGTPRFSRGPGLSTRTFRSAAAAAVARVHARVTPPASRQGTPRINARDRLHCATKYAPHQPEIEVPHPESASLREPLL